MAALPPSTTGQPAPWPSAVRRRPKADVNGARERLHGVRRRAGQQGPRRVGAEAARRVLHRRRPDQREAGEGQRVARHAAHRPEDIGHDPVEPLDQRPHQVLVGRGVAAEVRGRLADVPVERGGPAAVERMGEGHLGLAQHDARARPGRASGRRERPPAPDAPPSTRRGGSPRGSGPRSGSRPRWSAPPRRPRPRGRPGPA